MVTPQGSRPLQGLGIVKNTLPPPSHIFNLFKEKGGVRITVQAKGETKHHSSILFFCTNMYCSLFFKTCTAISRILTNNQNVQVKMLSF